MGCLCVHAALPRCALLDLGLQASVLEKCGFQPRGPGTQTYSIQDSHLCLAGTAEVPLAGMYMDKVGDGGGGAWMRFQAYGMAYDMFILAVCFSSAPWHGKCVL